ncbi:MAG: glycosyltransferase [Candidatus Kapabacteria bacterium]|nr:glycosyltransferase [Candidatus Kapabacteria bacterium]
MKKANFSLIIPTYQEEKILEHSLSLYTKELRDKFGFELIVSDGGSTDNTLTIAKEYADKIAYHKTNERQNISQGRNRGAEQANSDYLVFINADAEPKDLEQFFNLIIEFTLGNGKYAKYDAIATYVTSFPDQTFLKDKLFYAFFNFYFSFLLKIGLGMGRGECQILKKSTFDNLGGYNENIFAGEDFDLYRRVNLDGKVVFANDIIIYESPRRFRKYGYLRTILLWFVNSISVWAIGKSISKEWEAVR